MSSGGSLLCRGGSRSHEARGRALLSGTETVNTQALEAVTGSWTVFTGATARNRTADILITRLSKAPNSRKQETLKTNNSKVPGFRLVFCSTFFTLFFPFMETFFPFIPLRIFAVVRFRRPVYHEFKSLTEHTEILELVHVRIAEGHGGG
jgi:hypothetical protein